MTEATSGFDRQSKIGNPNLGGASAKMTEATSGSTCALALPNDAGWIGVRFNRLINQSGVSSYTCSVVKPSARMIRMSWHFWVPRHSSVTWPSSPRVIESA